LNKSKKVEKGFDGLLSDVQGVKLRKTVINKRLEAGRTIHLNLKTKAQLLTIISIDEQDEKQSHSLIIGKDRMLRIVFIADPFAPHVLMYVFIAESPLGQYLECEENP